MTQHHEMKHATLATIIQVSLDRGEMEKIEQTVATYLPEHYRDDCTEEIKNQVEEILQSKLQNQKNWFNMVEAIQDPYFAEVLCTQLHKRRCVLQPDFTSETPRG